MANNIDIKFSGLVELRAAKYLYKGTTPDKDCLRAIATNFYNSSYNYSSSGISGSSISDADKAFNRNNDDFALISSIRSFNFSNYRIRPQALVVLASTNSAGAEPLNISLTGFNEFGSELSINVTSGDMLTPNNQAPSLYVYNNLHLSNITFKRGWVDRITFTSGPQNIRLYQLYLYGEIIQKEQNKLPPTNGATTIESFTDSFLPVDPLNEGTIVKDGSIKLEPRRAFTSNRVFLTVSNYNIPDEAEYNVWNFDPNGFNRTIILPRAPVFNHYIRINNLNGAFRLIVLDSDASTTIQNLSTADGPNTLEAVWSGDQWIITV